MARRGDDPEAVVLEVVVGARGECELVLAAVAGARVDVAYRQAAAAVGAGEADLAPEPAQVAEERQHQRSAQA